jgi:hypothetical protein
MVKNLLSNRHIRQINPHESPKHGFSRGTIGCPLGVSSVHTRQFLIQIGQLLTRTMFDQSEYTQSDREQAHQAHRAFITVQIHRRQRKRLAFEPTKPAFNDILLTITSPRKPRARITISNATIALHIAMQCLAPRNSATCCSNSCTKGSLLVSHLRSNKSLMR